MSARIPPLKLARLVERARHHLALIHLRMAPPYAAMMELIVSAWTAQAITVAVELGIADALDKGPLRLEELASRVEADPDALRRLLRALIGRGIFRQRRDGRYELNALAKSLRTNAPMSAAAMAQMVGSRQHREHWSHLADSIKTGKAVIPAIHGMDGFDYLVEEPEFNAVFNRAMADTTEMAVDYLTGRLLIRRVPDRRRRRRRGGPAAMCHPQGDAVSSRGSLRPAARHRRSPAGVASAPCRRPSRVAGRIVLRQRSHGWRCLRAQDDPA